MIFDIRLGIRSWSFAVVSFAIGADTGRSFNVRAAPGIRIRPVTVAVQGSVRHVASTTIFRFRRLTAIPRTGGLESSRVVACGATVRSDVAGAATGAGARTAQLHTEGL
jgi:hypothetical protein